MMTTRASYLLFILIFLSHLSFGQNPIFGTWTVNEEGMKRAISLNEDGTGEFIRGDVIYQIINIDIEECALDDQLMIDMVITSDQGDFDLYTIFNLSDPDNVRMTTFPTKETRSEFDETYFTEGVQMIKE